MGHLAPEPQLSIPALQGDQIINSSFPLHFSACSRGTVESAVPAASHCHVEQGCGHCLQAATITLEEVLAKADCSSWSQLPRLGLQVPAASGVQHCPTFPFEPQLEPGGLAVSPPFPGTLRLPGSASGRAAWNRR